MLRRAATNRVLGVAAAVVVSTGTFAGVSMAGTYDVTYSKGTGTRGLNSVSDPKWYLADKKANQPFTVRPTNVGEKYEGFANSSSFHGAWAFPAPGDATITKVELGKVRGAYEGGQRTRLELRGAGGNKFDEDQPDLTAKPFKWGKQLFKDGDTWPAGGNPNAAGSVDVVLAPRDLNNNPLAAHEFRAWVYNRECSDSSDPCLQVNNPGTTGVSFESLKLTLEDKTAPTIEVNIAAGSGWTNNRRYPLGIVATDRDSGIVGLQVKDGSSRLLNLKNLKRESNGTDASGKEGIPPWLPERKFGQPARDLKNGKHKFRIIATNGVNATTTRTFTLYVDVQPPKVTWPRRVPSGKFVKLADKDSKLASGSLSVNGKVIAKCKKSGSSSCSLKIKGKQGDTAYVVAVDRAGNTTESTATIGGSRSSTSSTGKANVRVLNGKSFRAPVGVTAPDIKVLATSTASFPKSIRAYRGSKVSQQPIKELPACPKQSECTQPSGTAAFSLNDLGLGATAKSDNYTFTFAEVDKNGKTYASKRATDQLTIKLDREGPSTPRPSPASQEGAAITSKGNNRAVRRGRGVDVTVNAPVNDGPSNRKLQSGVKSYFLTVADSGGGALTSRREYRKKSIERKTVRISLGQRISKAAVVQIYAVDNVGNVGTTRSLPIERQRLAPPKQVPLDSNFAYGFDDQNEFANRAENEMNQLFATSSPATHPAPYPMLNRGIKDASGKNVPVTLLRFIAPIDTWNHQRFEPDTGKEILTENLSNKYLRETIRFFERANNRIADSPHAQKEKFEILITFIPHKYLGEGECSQGFNLQSISDVTAAAPAELPLLKDCAVPDTDLYGRYLRQWIAEIKSRWSGRYHIGSWNEPDIKSFGMSTLKNAPGGRDQDLNAGKLLANYWIAASDAVRGAGCGNKCKVVTPEFSSLSKSQPKKQLNAFILELEAQNQKPTAWGIHNYRDITPAVIPKRFRVSAKKNDAVLKLDTVESLISKVSSSTIGRNGKFWVTETGVMLQNSKGQLDKPQTDNLPPGVEPSIPLTGRFTPMAYDPQLAFAAAKRFGSIRTFDERIERAVYFLSMGPYPEGGAFDSGLLTSAPLKGALPNNPSASFEPPQLRPAFCGLIGVTQKRDATMNATKHCIWNKGGRGE